MHSILFVAFSQEQCFFSKQIFVRSSGFSTVGLRHFSATWSARRAGARRVVWPQCAEACKSRKNSEKQRRRGSLACSFCQIKQNLSLDGGHASGARGRGGNRRRVLVSRRNLRNVCRQMRGWQSGVHSRTDCHSRCRGRAHLLLQAKTWRARSKWDRKGPRRRDSRVVK
jgi:hypothetical protein